MPSHHTLMETEAAVSGKLVDIKISPAAMHAISGVHRAATATRNHMTNAVLRPHGLSWTGFVVLWSVWIFDNPETNEVADSAGISKATLSGVSQTLISRGWLIRTQSTTDKRYAHLALTEAGQALMAELFPRFNQDEQALVQDLTDDELEVLGRALRKVVKRAESLDGLDLSDLAAENASPSQ